MYTQQEVDKTLGLLNDMADATERKEPHAVNAITALREAADAIPPSANEVNEYLKE